MTEGISDYIFEEFVAKNRDWIGGQLEYSPKGRGIKILSIIFEIEHRNVGKMNIFCIRTSKGLYGFTELNTKSSNLIEIRRDGWNIFSTPDGSEFRIKKPEKSIMRKTKERDLN